MENSTQRSTYHKLRKRILGLVTGLVLLGLSIWFGLNAISRYQLMHYEHRMKKKGEHFDFADFVPKPVPANRNFALVPVVASSYEAVLNTSGRVMTPRRLVVNRLAMNLNLPGNLVGNWSLQKYADLAGLQKYIRMVAEKERQFSMAPAAQAPAAGLLLALGKYDKTIEALRAASSLPDSRFPLDYVTDPPEAILLPHLAPLKECSEVLELRAIAELKTGQSDKALADVKLAFRLIDSIRAEPFDISQLVRTEMFHLILQPIWEGIQNHDWSDRQLGELETSLSHFDFLAECESSERANRAMVLKSIEYVRRTRDLGLFSDDNGSTLIPLSDLPVLRFGPAFIYYQNELLVAQTCQDWLWPIVNAQAHSASPETAARAAANISQLRHSYSAGNIFAALLLPGFENWIPKLVYAQSSADMARIACALERFYLLHSEYPKSLNELIPKFIPSVPRDIIGGKSLKYYPAVNGQFVLYSVGWNATDDNGTVFVETRLPGTIELTQGDWVWSDAVAK